MRVDPGGMPHTSNWRAEERRRLSASEEDGDEPVTVVPCADCVTWAGEVEFQLLQTFRYYDFPFDRHTIRIEYVVQGGDLFTCKDRDGLAIMGIETDRDALEKLLPSTGTWFLDGSVDQAVKLSHPIDVTTGEPKREYCVVRIHIKRNWVIYFVKQICTMLLCTSGGLLGLLMQPGELLGDRVATLLVSILILITALQVCTPCLSLGSRGTWLHGRLATTLPPLHCQHPATAAMQADIGLGNLSYLIWVDVPSWRSNRGRADDPPLSCSRLRAPC